MNLIPRNTLACDPDRGQLKRIAWHRAVDGS